MRLFQVDAIILERYKITERLGGGGQSFTYKAEDTYVKNLKSWRRIVFVKQYSDLMQIESLYPKVKKHFYLITERISDINNLVCCPNEINICIKHGSIIAVFPYIEGIKLSERIKQNPNFEEKARISVALIKTIRKLHVNRIAHLDLKPDNIVITQKEDEIFIKLIDLDGSKIDGEGVRENIVKTPGYGSPEHYGRRKETTTINSDIFSLGVTILELLISKYPFTSTDTYLDEAKERQFAIPSSPIHADIIRILTECLEYSPDFRPSAGTLLNVFNSHYTNKLLATSDSQRYYPLRNKCFVKIVIDGKIPFSRTYYEDKIITSSDLWESDIKNISGVLFAIAFQSGHPYILFQPEKFLTLLDGHIVATDKLHPLLSEQVLTLEGNKFNLSVSYFM